MSLQIKVLTGAMLTTAFSLGAISLTADPLLSQTINTDPLYEIADDTVEELLVDNDCAILTTQGFIIIPDDADADIDDDERAERFCTPGFVQRIEVNEYFSQTDILVETDLDDDGTLESDETHVIEINSINSGAVRQIEPGNYYVVVTRTGTVNEANAIDFVQVSEDEARALLEEIERSRSIVVTSAPAPAPAPVPAPIPAPVPAPVPQVQPAPTPGPVPALW